MGLKISRILCISMLSLSILKGNAQSKKPLDHSVYDGWQSVQERVITANGQYAAYTINPQEGDGYAVIQSLDNAWKVELPRGYNLKFSPDGKYITARIKPFFKETREARIKKKRPDEMPKDTLAIIQLGSDQIVKKAKVKQYSLGEKGGEYLLMLMEKAAPLPAQKPDSATQMNKLIAAADSLSRVADSLKKKYAEAQIKGLKVLESDKSKSGNGNKKAEEPFEEGTEFVVRNLQTGQEQSLFYVTEFLAADKQERIWIEFSKRKSDSNSKATIGILEPRLWKLDSIFIGFNDAKNPVWSKDAAQLSFIAEKDSSSKAIQKFYGLYFYEVGNSSAKLIANRKLGDLPNNTTVSEFYSNKFSDDGSRLFFGFAPIRKPKDTTLVDFETARLDIWHYNEDYLQPQQLLQVNSELRRSNVAIWQTKSQKTILLSEDYSDRLLMDEAGNAPYFGLVSTKGNRKEAQWVGRQKQQLYIVDANTGKKSLVLSGIDGNIGLSPNGKYAYWYDLQTQQYYTLHTASKQKQVISQSVKWPLYDVEDDHPDAPPAYGIAGFSRDENFVFVYDQFDIWRLSLSGKEPAVNVTKGFGRTNKITWRWQRTNTDTATINPTELQLLRGFNNINKQATLTQWHPGEQRIYAYTLQPYSYSVITKAQQANRYLVQRANIDASNLFETKDLQAFQQLTTTNLQQSNYNWLTVELMKWKMFDGKMSEGLLFKPADFDPNKKYPVIFYFYERDSDGLYNYRAPAPSRSTVNIPWFVSNGYIVFDPNIYYKDGYPGESAYNSVVSAAKHLAKMPWVDSTKMAIQGQSWGGYQVAYLVTRTNLFAAAGSGAPVANMTSAYGGIRWGTGLNRQFQYERTQSRIGATLWEKKDLYLQNSPLFSVPKIKTPLLIMHNDKDDAVPWYQGIEMFTAMRRLNKPVWLLQYNDELHNLSERRNAKDLSIRLAQFFDHYLKGKPMPKWMSKGVPAIEKGIDWGLDYQ